MSFAELKDPAKDELKRFGLFAKIGEEPFYPTIEAAVLVGALIGGATFRLFGIWPGLEAFSISLRDVVAAIIGSLIFLAVLWFVRNRGTG